MEEQKLRDNRATVIARRRGVTFYEHPKYGDMVPLLASYGGRVYNSGFHDVPYDFEMDSVLEQIRRNIIKELQAFDGDIYGDAELIANGEEPMSLECAAEILRFYADGEQWEGMVPVNKQARHLLDLPFTEGR